MIQNQLQVSLAQNKQVIPYFTCGDLSLAFTYELVCQTFEQGINILELGIPFSDPIADGPVIQESHQRALAVKPDVSLDDAFSIVNTVKKRYPNKHIVLCLPLILLFNMEMTVFLSGQNRLDCRVSLFQIWILNMDLIILPMPNRGVSV